MNPTFDHTDYRRKPKTPRHAAADDLAAYLNSVHLCVRTDAVRDESGKFYENVLFPTAFGSGKVRTYGAGYIYVALFVELCGMDHKVDRVYGSVEEAAAFLELLLKHGDVDGAELIPQRKPAARKKTPEPA